MPTLDPRIDEYIERAPAYAQPILKKVRRAFHVGCPKLVETMKWSRPHFEHEGLLGGIAAFKAHVTIGFWRGKELDDPAGLFEGVGKTEMWAAKVASTKDLPTQKVLADYVKRAAVLSATTPRSKQARATKRPAPSMPADLKTALVKSKKARTFFESLAPGQQRDYVEWITGAKRDATRAKRLATTVEWLAEGKRRNWKYENC